MIINYFGKQFFKISQGDFVIAFNPTKKSKFGASLALSTINHEDYNNVNAVTYGPMVPFFVNGPGEYEFHDVFILGYGVEVKFENKKYINSVYFVNSFDFQICFLGVLNEIPKFSEEIQSKLENSDIIFTPIGEKFLSPKKSWEFASSFSPKIIIPMDYNEKELSEFLKVSKQEKIKPLDKFIFKRKDYMHKNLEVIVLNY